MEILLESATIEQKRARGGERVIICINKSATYVERTRSNVKANGLVVSRLLFFFRLIGNFFQKARAAESCCDRFSSKEFH